MLRILLLSRVRFCHRSSVAEICVSYFTYMLREGSRCAKARRVLLWSRICILCFDGRSSGLKSYNSPIMTLTADDRRYIGAAGASMGSLTR